MKRLTAKRDYHLVLQSNTQPAVSIIIPTYNEASVIEQKLSNIAQGAYPLSRLEMIIVDSASSDGTKTRSETPCDISRTRQWVPSLESTMCQPQARPWREMWKAHTGLSIEC